MGSENSFRVVSGRYKGAKLSFPGDSRTHPMGARGKLALFNIVSTSGMRVLDVYAGSGALGIEALSRGAREVVFVEKVLKVAQVIRENLEKIGIRAKIVGKDPRKRPLEGAEKRSEAGESVDGCVAKVFVESAEKFTERGEFRGEFDRILADPPYESFRDGGRTREELEALSAMLARDGELVLSSPASQAAPELGGLEIVTTRTYAGARITVYTK